MTKEEMNFWTGVVLMSTGAIWLVWEIILIVGRGKGQDWDTISMFTTNGALHLSALPVFWGILAGHLFLNTPMNNNPPLGFQSWWIWVVVLALFGVSDAFFYNTPRENLPGFFRLVRTPFFGLMVGLASGFLSWPQRISW
jgi:sterol desaturase/sphingolipid hydroxylase (fatty acid hydroxylase superfamily)